MRPAGFEPATRCLEGSRSIRLSYRRSVTSVQVKGHTWATRGSQCCLASSLAVAGRARLREKVLAPQFTSRPRQAAVRAPRRSRARLTGCAVPGRAAPCLASGQSRPAADRQRRPRPRGEEDADPAQRTADNA